MEMEQTNKTHSQPPPEYSQQPQYGFQAQQPQYGFQAQQPHYGYIQGAPVINVTQPVVMEQPQTIILNSNVGPDPTTITCPSCRTTVVTAMDYESTTKTHIIAGLLCIFGCWLCVCIPYCTGCCRNANHYCPSCGAYIGTYSQ